MAPPVLSSLYDMASSAVLHSGEGPKVSGQLRAAVFRRVWRLNTSSNAVSIGAGRQHEDCACHRAAGYLRGVKVEGGRRRNTHWLRNPTLGKRAAGGGAGGGGGGAMECCAAIKWLGDVV